MLDFGPGSVDGWLASLVADELGVGGDDELDEDARELTVHGESGSRSPRSSSGCSGTCASARAAASAGRELLREVWGTEFTGGSNVVDAVVRSLRHKLGAEAMVVETVRGSGYRLRADWRAHLS